MFWKWYDEKFCWEWVNSFELSFSKFIKKEEENTRNWKFSINIFLFPVFFLLQLMYTVFFFLFIYLFMFYFHINGTKPVLYFLPYSEIPLNERREKNRKQKCWINFHDRYKIALNYDDIIKWRRILWLDFFD